MQLKDTLTADEVARSFATEIDDMQVYSCAAPPPEWL